MGLVALFAALAASTLLVPGLIHLLSERFTILFATVLIYPFVAINYLNLGTIGSKVAYYLLAVLAGLGCGAVFSAQAVYITRNSHISTIGRNFGIVRISLPAIAALNPTPKALPRSSKFNFVNAR